MGTLTGEGEWAVEAVAEWASAYWEEGSGEGPPAWIWVDRRRIAIEVAVIVTSPPAVKPRLRFDRVVVRLLDGLRATLAEIVPDHAAAIVTLAAPIRLPARAEAAIATRVRERVAAPAAGDIVETIHGNAVRIRLVEGVTGGPPKLVGFVHNPGTDTGLIDLAELLLRQLGAAAARPLPEGFAGPRWLVLGGDGGRPAVEAWRHVCAALPAAATFERVLLVHGQGRVVWLAGAKT